MEKKFLNFKDWLDNTLSEPVHENYDINGNSSRAVVTRGLKNEIFYQFKHYPSSIKYEISTFDGFDTPIGYFINIFLMIFLAPLVPILKGLHSYNSAMKTYRKIYQRVLKESSDDNIKNDTYS